MVLKTLRHFIFLFIYFFNILISFSQNITSENALSKFKKLDSLSALYFENQNVEQFLSVYIKQIELLPQIPENDYIKFQFFKDRSAYFNRMELYNESIKNGKKSLDVFFTLESKEDINRSLNEAFCIYADLAGNYLKTNRLDSATIAYKEAIDFSIKNDIADLFKASGLNNLGMHLLNNLKQSDSSLFYFRAAEQVMQKLPDSLHPFRGSIRDNIADAYLNNNKLENANELYHINFKFYFPESLLKYKSEKKYSVRDYERWLKAGLQAAETDLSLKKIASAEKTLSTIDSLLLTNRFEKKAESRQYYFSVLEKLYAAKQNLQKATFYSKKSRTLSDSINRVNEANQNLWNITLKQNLINHYNEKHELEQLQLKTARQNERFGFWLTLIILLAIIAGISFLIIIYKQRLKISNKTKLITENKLELTQLKSKFLDKEISSKKKDLSNFALNLSQNYNWTEEFYIKLRKLQSLKGRSKGKELQTLEEEIKNRVNYNNINKDFNTKVETLSNRFYSTLREQYPNLTPDEVKLCAMIRLGVDNYEIGILHNIHQNSVHQKRYRLKKKLKLEAYQDLDMFLKSL